MRQQIAGTTPTRLRSFHTAGGIRSHVTNVVMVVLAQAVVGFHTASGMRSHVTTISTGRAPTPIGFNTASGMRSHVTLCLGGRRNRRLKSWFWKTSSKPNMRSHFFGCHYIPRGYVMTLPSLMQQGLRRFEENRKTYPIFSPLRGFPVVHTVAWFLIFVKQKRHPISSERGRR